MPATELGDLVGVVDEIQNPVLVPVVAMAVHEPPIDEEVLVVPVAECGMAAAAGVFVVVAEQGFFSLRTRVAAVSLETKDVELVDDVLLRQRTHVGVAACRRHDALELPISHEADVVIMAHRRAPAVRPVYVRHEEV